MSVTTNTAWRVAGLRRFRVTKQLYCGLV